MSCFPPCFFPRFRFKHHLFDLTFIEKLTRWLTNTQVKVKTEVAESNGQAQRLMHHLNVLEKRVDACEKPNLDKEVSQIYKFWCENLLVFEKVCMVINM